MAEEKIKRYFIKPEVRFIVYCDCDWESVGHRTETAALEDAQGHDDWHEDKI